jgi:hypothetical protein
MDKAKERKSYRVLTREKQLCLWRKQADFADFSDKLALPSLSGVALAAEAEGELGCLILADQE